jgi:hypothetical protein
MCVLGVLLKSLFDIGVHKERVDESDESHPVSDVS